MREFLKTLQSKMGDVPLWIYKSLENINHDWSKILFSKKASEYLVDIFMNLDNDIENIGKGLSPHYSKIFEFARLTDINNINAVILGQDPYPNPDHAHGIAFSSKDKKIPASLKNIYNCLINFELIDEMPKTADLTIWCKRGILLLNTALTTKAGESESHLSLWHKYTKLIIKKIDKMNKNKIKFLLWGAKAKKYERCIKHNEIMLWKHPSPLAQRKGDSDNFISCDHFSKINIDWSLQHSKIVAYTDGSAEPNIKKPQAKNGYAVIFQSGVLKYEGIFGSCAQKIRHPKSDEYLYSTSQRAEGFAILYALKKCYENRDKNWDVIEIITDSAFWINMINVYIPNWVRNKINFANKKNPDIVESIWDMVTKLKASNKIIQLRHIPSHGKDKSYKNATAESQKYIDYEFNELADDLAKHARKNLEYGEHYEVKKIFE